MINFRKNLSRNILISLLIANILLCSCSLLPRSNYQRPNVQLPGMWQNQAVTGGAVADREKWWGNFNDPVLNELIDRALRTNNDLAAAAIKVRRARLKSGLTDTNITPTVDVNAAGSINRDLKNSTDSKSYSVTGALSYELDLWGKLAAARDSSRWEAEATEVDRQNTALSLIGTTAKDYWQIAYLNTRINLCENSIAYAEKTLELVNIKYEAGAVSGLDVSQAKQTLAGQRAALTDLIQQRTEARNALAILFDQVPQNSLPELKRLPDGPLPAIEPGLPASLLRQRPDLRAAELRLREYLADVDQSRASFYPSFTLTGSLGGSSTSLKDVLQNPVATLGAGLVLPFIQWNTMQLTVKISQTTYEEAVVNFRQTLYKALCDVENALSADAQNQAASSFLEESLAYARKAEQLAEVRYRAGATGVQDWLDAQETRRIAETTLATNHLNRLKNLMTLYQALGGDTRLPLTPSSASLFKE
ncbi:MAG: efflux transporter outer membrane subunit [Smithella sp.]